MCFFMFTFRWFRVFHRGCYVYFPIVFSSNSLYILYIFIFIYFFIYFFIVQWVLWSVLGDFSGMSPPDWSSSTYFVHIRNCFCLKYILVYRHCLICQGCNNLFNGFSVHCFIYIIIFMSIYRHTVYTYSNFLWVGTVLVWCWSSFGLCIRWQLQWPQIKLNHNFTHTLRIIKLYSETQVSDRLGMSGGISPRHAQNPLSGEQRKMLSITHHALSPPPSHHHGVLGWLLVVVLFAPIRGGSLEICFVCWMLLRHCTEALVYSNHPRAAAASSYLAIIFGRIASGVPWFLRSTAEPMQHSHQCWRWCRLW